MDEVQTVYDFKYDTILSETYNTVSKLSICSQKSMPCM